MAGDGEVGTAWLQVNPSLRGFHTEVKKKLKEELSGVGADIPIGLDSTKLTADLDKVHAKLDKFAARRVEASAGVATSRFDRDLSRADKRLDLFGSRDAAARLGADSGALTGVLDRSNRVLDLFGRRKVDPKLGADAAVLNSQIDQAQARLDALREQKVSPKVDLDIAAATARLDQMRAKLHELEQLDSTPKVDADISAARAGIAQIEEQLRVLAAQKADPKVDLDIAAAEAQLARMRLQLATLGDRDVKVRVDTDAMERAAGGALRLGASLTAAASAVSLLAASAGAISGLGAALISTAGAAALIPAALGAGAAAFGAVKLGIGGLEDAFTALSAQDDASASDAVANGKKRETANRSVATAIAGVEDAQRQADRTAVRGREQVADSERAYTAAQARAKDSQDALNRSREEAVEDIEDLRRSLSGAALSETAAQIGLERAQERLAKAVREGATGLDLREAKLGVDQAAQSLDEAKDRYKDLAAEAEHADKVGVEGSDKVVAAKRAQAEADDAARQAGVQLARTRRAADEANADSARAVARAQEQVREASRSAGDEATSSALKVATAMAKLSPNARRFVDEIRGLQPAWDGLKFDVQDRLLDGVGDRVRELAGTYLPRLRSMLSGIADGFNDAFQESSQFLLQDKTARDLGGAFDKIKDSLRTFSSALLPITRIFTDLFVVGSEFLPGIADGFKRSADRAADFFHAARDDGRLSGWIRTALDNLHALWDTLKNVGSIFFTVFEAADKNGVGFLQTLRDLTGSVKGFLRSPEGNDLLTGFFKNVRDFVDRLEPGLSAIWKGITDTIREISPKLPGIADSFSRIAEKLAPILKDIAVAVFDAFAWAFDVLSRVPVPVLLAAAGVFAAIYTASKAKDGLDKLNTLMGAFGSGGTFVVAKDNVGKIFDKLGGKKDSVLSSLTDIKNLGGLAAILGIGAALAGLQILDEEIQKRLQPTRDKPPAERTVGEATGLAAGDALHSTVNPDLGAKTANTTWQTFWAPGFDDGGFENSAVAKIGRGIGNFFSTVFGDWVGGFFTETLPGFFTDLWSEVKIGWSDFTGQLGRAADTVGTWWTENVWTPTKDFFTGLPGTISTWWKDNVWTPTSNFFTSLPGTVSSWWTDNVAAPTGAWFSGLPTRVSSWWTDNVGAPTGAFFTGLPGTVSAWWEDDVAAPTGRFFGGLWQRITDWWHTNVWQPTSDFFTGLPGTISSWWENNVAKPTGSFFSGLPGRVSTWWTDDVWVPTRDFFTGLGPLIAKTWEERVAAPLRDAWTRMKDGFGEIWSQVKRKAAEPINFVINEVYGRDPSKGIRGLWKTVAGWVGLPELPAPGPDIAWATGGPVRGPGSGTSDSIPVGVYDRRGRRRGEGRVSDGEHIWTARETAAAGGHAGVQALRSAALSGDLARWAGGGGVDADSLFGMVRKQFPDAIKTSGYRPGDPGYHGKNLAVDVAMSAPRMRELSYALAAGYPSSREIIHTPGANVKDGRPFTYSAGVRADHWDHVHWALGGLSATGSATATGGPLADIWAGITDIVGAAKGVFADLLGSVLPDMTGRFGASPWTGAAARVPGKVVDAVIEKARGAWETTSSWFGGGGSGVEQWRGLVDQALAMLGLPAGWSGSTLRRMDQESGGDPRAINNWDINALRGTPSKGLMQVIDPTFRANWDPRTPNDIWNPLSNIVASMRYAMRRYGSLPAAYDRKGGYDSGGWLPPGATMAINDTGRPEAVLTARQWDSVETIVGSHAGQQAASGDSVVITAREPLSNSELSRLAAEIDRRKAWQKRLA